MSDSVKLRQCRVCKEWFNTNQSIMVAHYRLRHERLFQKTMAIGELIVKRALFLAQANTAPWPLSMQYSLAALATQSQIDRVVLSSDEQ